MPDPTRGANATIAGTSLLVAVAGARRGAVDLMVFQVGESGKVRSGADFVFPDEPSPPKVLSG